MALYPDEQSHTIVPTIALLAFVEAALALVNSGISSLPDDELEHVSVYLEHATALAIQEARMRRSQAGSPTQYQVSALPVPSGHGLSTPKHTVKTEVGSLEGRLLSLSIQST